MGLNRKHKHLLDQAARRKIKLENRGRKAKERTRREARMLAEVRGGTMPFTPVVRSWLSRKLGKPFSKFTPEDLQVLKT